ncbi:ras-related protein RabC-like [Dysidea avara]|uniref:ras-related protein RabC-like n=1 Tax=Dysidea avara TaxID=196820 RepID=UPI00332BB23F
MASDTNLLKATTDKVVLIGDVGVGKTSIFTRFKSNEFDESSKGHNPKEDKFTKMWKPSGGSEVSITLFDTAGIERHMSTIPPTYFRSAKAVILVYSITDAETFDSLSNWIENAVSAMGVGTGGLVKVLVGNKVDLDSDRQVDRNRAEEFAKNVDINSKFVLETSAKTNKGIDDLFNLVAMEIAPSVKQSPKGGAPKTEKSKCCSQT